MDSQDQIPFVPNYRKCLNYFEEFVLSMVFKTMDKMPDKVLLQIFGYLNHREILRCAVVCKKWRTIAYDSRLWQVVSLRPDYNGLQVNSLDTLLALISIRFGPSLRLIELPMELIQVSVLTELSTKCPKLSYITFDFSNAMQLHDFNDLQTFPARLRSLTLCLSEVIFLEGFMRKIYNFISSVEVLHLIGTFEKVEDEEPEVFEVLNLHKLKAYVPNLRVCNLWGVVFVTDEHIESLTTNCAQIEVLCINFCQKVKGACLKTLFGRCKKLKTLLMEQALLDSKIVAAAKWEDTQIQELNITATELSADCLMSLLPRLPHLKWLSAAYLEFFTNQVLDSWIASGSVKSLLAVDLTSCDSLTDSSLTNLLSAVGPQLSGLMLGGIPPLIEHFWITNIPKLKNVKVLTMGIQEDCCAKVTAKIHIDKFIDSIANNCPKIERLEIRWDPETLRFSDKSAKFIDLMRMKCLRLHSLTLSDGRFFELVRSNFERADRKTVVRTTNYCRTSIVQLLQNYRDLLFN